MPCRCSVMTRHRLARVAAADRGQQPGVLGVGVGQHLGRVGDVGDEVAHRALRLGDQGRQARAARRLGQPDVEARVGLAVGGEVVQRGRPSRPRARRAAASSAAARAPAASTATPDLDGQAGVADLAPAREQRRRRRVGRGRALGHEGPAAAAAHGVQVAALAQRGQRLAQRRAGDPEQLAQLALGRQPLAGRAAARA